MKNILLFLAFLLVSYSYGQQKIKTTGEFVRVYNLQNKKVGKGKIIVLSDSLLKLKRNRGEFSFSPQEIGFIHTKRAPGNNVLIGSLSGATILAIAGASSSDPDGLVLDYTPGEGALMGALFGIIPGAALGYFTVIFKKSEVYPINGNLANWQTFRNTRAISSVEISTNN